MKGKMFMPNVQEKPILFTKSQLKEEFGFTEKMIKLLLGEPIEKTNPHYKCAAPMKLWTKEEVDVVITSDEYKELKAKADKRRASAKKAVATKTEKIVSEMSLRAEQIKVTKVSDEKLMEWTLEAKQDWYDEHQRGGEARNAYEADENTKKRWAVNYIRHNLTDYDYDMDALVNKVGKDKAYNKYKEAVLDKIAEVYPDLAYECENQKISWSGYWY